MRRKRRSHFQSAAERMGNKSLRSQLWTIQIIARQAVTAGVQFAGNADRDRLQMFVEDINLRIGNGPANRNGPAPGQWRGDSMAAGEGCVFRRPVTVD